MTVTDQAGWAARKCLAHLPDGRPMAFVDSGGTGPVLLLLHGYSDSSRSFSLLEPRLSGYRLIIPDLPGHGSSAIGRGLTVKDFAGDVEALLAILKIERCLVVGHSMGAMIAMALAVRLPERIDGLVLMSGTLRPAFVPEDSITQWIVGLCDPIDPADPFFHLWHAGPHPIDAGFLRWLSLEAAAIPAAIWRGILDEFSRLDLTLTARQISVPVLCIAGSEDALFNAPHQRALIRELPGAASIILEGFGHNPHWEDPSRVALCIEQFAQSVHAHLRVADA